MSANQKSKAVEASVGRETLEETALRTLKLLRAIGTSLPIRSALVGVGYEDADHQEGWTLLHAASGYAPTGTADAIDVDVHDAIATLDAWDEDGFRIIRASLSRKFPAIAGEILQGIGPKVGPEAVVGVATLLDRLDALEKRKDKDAKAAMELLAKRGITPAERARLGALVKTAQSVTPVVSEKSAKAESERKKADATHLAALVALRAWYEEWSEIARSAIKRRDRLILMGLATRKSPTPKQKKSDGDSSSTPSVPKAAGS
jgi:hypothetical protein